MKKIWLQVICGMMLVSLLSGCGATKENEIIRLGSMPTYSAAIYAVGIDQGFFEEAGVEVELTIFKSALERDSAAISGELDGFMTDIMGSIKLNEKGYPYIMTGAEYEDFAVMLSSAGADKLMEERTIGLSEATIVEYVVDTYLQGDPIKEQIVALPDRLAMLNSQQIDMGVFPQPFIGMAIGGGSEVLVSTASMNFYPVVLNFDQTYMNENEKAVDAFYEGYQKSVAYMQEHPYDDYKEALVAHGLATENTVDLFRLPVDAYGYHPVLEDDFEAVKTWMLEKGYLTMASIMYEDLVENQSK